jgi:hypothetical protein
MKNFNAFIAGFVSTLLFHQGVLAALHAGNPDVPAPFDLTATAPFQVPAVISLAFWGGLWGIAIWQLLKNSSGFGYWLTAIIIGAIGPSAVALFIVMPLKGLGVAMGWNPQIIVGALVLNAAWGFGVGLMMRILPQGAPAEP